GSRRAVARPTRSARPPRPPRRDWCPYDVATRVSRPGDELPLGEFGPAVHGGRPRSGGPDWRRVLALGGITVLVAAVLMAGTYAGLLWYRLNDINTLDISSAPTFDQVVPPGEDGGGVQPG